VCNPPWAGAGHRWGSGPLTAALPLVAALAGCEMGLDLEVDQAQYALAEPGPWIIPPETLEIGDEQWVPYTGAGPWIGESGCSDGLKPGAAKLRDYIYTYFPQTYQIGGFSCRAIVGNSSSMSVHATGRALDIMIPTIGGEANNSLGDPIGNWLIENAETIGIQFIIWDNWTWRADRSAPKDRSYGGAHPHHDHLHVELSEEAANLGTAFFQAPFEPPVFASCGTIGREGGVVENADRCARFFGASSYWRSAEGRGHSGSLLWTNSLASEEPANWARWNLDFAESGRYRAEVYLTPEYAESEMVRYEVVHGGEAEVVFVDQSAAHAEGWYAIGDFEFAAGGGQHISLFDNVHDASVEGRRIAFDALRLTPYDPTSDSREGGAPSPSPEPEPELGPGISASVTGGCAAAGSRGAGPLSAILLSLLALRLRRFTARRGGHAMP
jgi:hypothetical protein